MPSMPIYYVGKGSQFKTIDDQFGPNADYMAAYAAALARINQPLDALAQQHVTPLGSPGLTQKDVDHFRNDWLGRWWQGKHVEDVLRAGYREAITRAQTANKPIESIWVCADEKEFQVYICEGPLQFTVIVFTPAPPKHRPIFGRREHSEDPLTQDEQITVVKVKDKSDDEYTRLGATNYQVVDQANQIIKRQVRYAP
jgi:hypothetical protein